MEDWWGLSNGVSLPAGPPRSEVVSLRPRRPPLHIHATAAVAVRAGALGLFSAFYILEVIPRWLAAFFLLAWVLATRGALAMQLTPRATSGLQWVPPGRREGREATRSVVPAGGGSHHFIDLLSLHVDLTHYELMVSHGDAAGNQHGVPQHLLGALAVHVHHTKTEGRWAQAAPTSPPPALSAFHLASPWEGPPVTSSNGTEVPRLQEQPTPRCSPQAAQRRCPPAACGIPGLEPPPGFHALPVVGAAQTAAGSLLQGAGRLREEAEEEAACAICLDDYVDGVRVMVLPCQHAFHECCATQWLKQQGMEASCPLCKAGVFQQQQDDMELGDLAGL